MTLHKVVIGGAQIGQKYGISNTIGMPNIDEIDKILNLARKSGINYIDTAQSYGKSEKILGNFSKSHWNLNTKFILNSEDLKSNSLKRLISERFKSSLKNLKTDRIYSVMLHDISCLQDSSAQKIWQSLCELKENNFVQKIGYSIYRPEHLDLIYKKFKPDIIQTPFNILDQRIKSSGWLDILKKENVEVHARSVFLQGLLLMESKDISLRFEKWSMEFKKLFNWFNDKGLSKLEGCLYFAFSEPKIDKFVIGINTEKELKQIIKILINNKNEVFDYISNVDDQNLLEPINW